MPSRFSIPRFSGNTSDYTIEKTQEKNVEERAETVFGHVVGGVHETQREDGRKRLQRIARSERRGQTIEPFAELPGTVHGEKTARIVSFHREQEQRGQVVFLADLRGFVEVHGGEKLLDDELVVKGGGRSTAVISAEAADAFLE